MTEISMDARVLITAFFGYGGKTSLKIGGVGCQSILSDRASAAMDELVSAGLVTAEKYNDYGRMLYTGTDACRDLKLSMSKMEKFGGWSATIPNPDRDDKSQ